jgi:glycerophosphoryl diester phosphodiesterase
MTNRMNLGFGRGNSGLDEQPAGIWQKDFYRIGHSGASGYAQANTLESLSLALEMGVDMVEFDVRPTFPKPGPEHCKGKGLPGQLYAVGAPR